MKVLLVEDDPVLGRAMQRTMADAGHQVLGPMPSTGAALLLALAEHPALAIIDLDLAHTQDCERLARTLNDMQIPTIVMSNELEKVASTSEVAIAALSKSMQPAHLPEALDVAAQIILKKQMPDRLPPSMSILRATLSSPEI